MPQPQEAPAHAPTSARSPEDVACTIPSAGTRQPCFEAPMTLQVMMPQGIQQPYFEALMTLQVMMTQLTTLDAWVFLCLLAKEVGERK